MVFTDFSPKNNIMIDWLVFFMQYWSAVFQPCNGDGKQQTRETDRDQRQGEKTTLSWVLQPAKCYIIGGGGQRILLWPMQNTALNQRKVGDLEIDVYRNMPIYVRVLIQRARNAYRRDNSQGNWRMWTRITSIWVCDWSILAKQAGKSVYNARESNRGCES